MKKIHILGGLMFTGKHQLYYKIFAAGKIKYYTKNKRKNWI
jgi:hypothetical protein